MGTLERKKTADKKEDSTAEAENSRKINKKSDKGKNSNGNSDQKKLMDAVSIKDEKTKDLRETINLAKSLKISSSQSNPDFKSHKNDDIGPRKVSQQEPPRRERDRRAGPAQSYENFGERNRQRDNRDNRHSFHEANLSRAERRGFQQQHQQQGDEYSNYRQAVRGGGRERELRRGASFGQETLGGYSDRRGESEPKEAGGDWSWGGGRGRGDFLFAFLY